MIFLHVFFPLSLSLSQMAYDVIGLGQPLLDQVFAVDDEVLTKLGDTFCPDGLFLGLRVELTPFR